jgi:AcrR family transcriptional regulator
MAKVRTPRGAWIEAALKALSSGGVDAVRVEALAASLGVSKGGFYWHFKDRQALLEEMLDTWERAVAGDVIVRIESEQDEPRAKFEQLFQLARTADFGAELAVRDWARREQAVAARVRRVDNRRMEYLRLLFGQLGLDEEEAEARSLLAFSLFIGTYFVAAEHQGRSRSEVLQLALDHLLGAPRRKGEGADR